MAVSRRSAIAFARGEVFWCELDPVEGSEQGGRRPVVLISNDDFAGSPVRTVVPMTLTEYRGEAAFVVKVLSHQSGINGTGWALGHQVRTVAISRLSGRVGFIDPDVLNAIEEAVRYALDLEC